MLTIDLIDDDPAMLALLTALVRREGWQSRTCSTAEEARVAWSTSIGDVVVLDMMLGEDSGIDLLRHLRLFSTAPVLMLSGRDREADMAAAKDAGANDFLSKPLNPADFGPRIRRLAEP